jgi:two-component system alkaline phosphatase synthesis response regulator PhoP
MPKKILIVEDEKILAEMYHERFRKAGYDVFLATESKEALEIAKREKPDLIVLDILLPREDGIDFLRWLRKDKNIAQTPVIVFSNYDDPTAKKAATEFEVKEYLIKANYTPKDILEKVKSYLGE